MAGRTCLLNMLCKEPSLTRLQMPDFSDRYRSQSRGTCPYAAVREAAPAPGYGWSILDTKRTVASSGQIYCGETVTSFSVGIVLRSAIVDGRRPISLTRPPSAKHQ